MSKPRVWELDALRGLCILGMVVVHLVYDLTDLYGLITWEYPAWFSFLMDWGGVLFFLISGVSATFGSRGMKRGFLVFSCGMVCTAVTVGMYLLGFSRSVIIYFGALHSLGVCMMLWIGLKRLPTICLILFGCVLAAAGLMIRNIPVPFPYLTPLGLVTADFSTADFFPLLPYLGFFLLGAGLGRTIYKEKVSLLPSVNADVFPIRFLRACGRASLPIYLLHQPVITGLCWLLTAA